MQIFNKYIKLIIASLAIIMLNGCDDRLINSTNEHKSSAGSKIGSNANTVNTNFNETKISDTLLTKLGNMFSNIGNNAQGVSAYFNDTKPTNLINMNIEWSLDGSNGDSKGFSKGYNLHDIVWHLMTLTVKNQTVPLATPVAVKGLQYEFRPKPHDQRGEKIEVVDINCDKAYFSKNGDSCSVYVRLSYDMTTGTTDTPSMSVQFATKAYPDLSATFQLNTKPLFSVSQADYRNILPIETKYYSGSNVAANPAQYQMLNIKNVATLPVTITSIGNLTNPTFTLMHRSTDKDNDPYYGAYNECAISAKPDIKQVNQLPSMSDECILVYKASSVSTQIIQKNSIFLETDAKNIIPWVIGDGFNLTANYAVGVPIPEQNKDGTKFLVTSGKAHPSGGGMYMDTDGVLNSDVLHTDKLFRYANVSYKFIPRRIYPVSNGEMQTTPSVINLTTSPTIQRGGKILTDVTNGQVTVGSVTEVIPLSSSTSSITGHVDTCEGSWAEASADLTEGPNTAKNGMIYLRVLSNSDGNCGSSVQQMWEDYIPLNPLNGFSKQVYHVATDHCGGAGGPFWSNHGDVDVEGNGCNVSGDTCSYTVHVHAWHGGGDRYCVNSTQFTLNFTRPTIYYQLSDFSPRLNYTPRFVAYGGQQLNAAIGDKGGQPVTQSITCDRDGWLCKATGTPNVDLSSHYMSYWMALNAGDWLESGKAQFTRSDGYDFTDFIISH
jgi:hypothetical protein